MAARLSTILEDQLGFVDPDRQFCKATPYWSNLENTSSDWSRMLLIKVVLWTIAQKHVSVNVYLLLSSIYSSKILLIQVQSIIFNPYIIVYRSHKLGIRLKSRCQCQLRLAA